MYLEDTIAAIATAPGEGGIGIVRISGEKAEAILRSIFIPVKIERKKAERTDSFSPEGKECFLPEATNMTIGGTFESRKMTYGYVIDQENGEVKKIDEALAVYMKKPHTYTMEDVVEINCHGSMVSLKKTLALALRYGARLAEPGEFTKRAFLNGRIDLSQAEAVIDLIRAKTDKGYYAAMDQLSGRLSQKVRALRAEMTEILVEIAVNIDYPDEDIELVSYEKLEADLKRMRESLIRLKNTMDTGRILRDGLKTAIVGKPNVGKSSLMNRLLGENRSIVTDIPGTTRDTIEELLSIKGIYLRITDTAGIRKTDDIVEKIGVEKSREMCRNADLILFLLDGSTSLSPEDEELFQEIQEKKAVVLINKSDKGQVLKKEEIEKRVMGKTVIETSMEDGRGLAELEQEIEHMVYDGSIKAENGVIVTNERHGALLEKAIQAVEDGIFSTEGKEALEIIEIDVRNAWDLLGEITGETASENLIDEIFSRFCLGK